MTISLETKIKEVYQHPVGRDVLDKLLLFANKSKAWLTNPLVANLKLKTIKGLLKKKLDDHFWDQFLWLLNSETDRPLNAEGKTNYPWWKEAVFYQIYPRSFKDSNGDGLGDLPGIIEKLDYLKSLGVDAIWLSPIYDSPNDDMGYDIRDYQKIMAEMGTMEDFDRLLAGLHDRGMRLIMDLVINHTSDEHRWFQEALKDPAGPYGEYYFFRKGQVGDLPNNWVSFFSGSAWNYYPEIERYALHLFSPKQMDLNWESEAMRQDLYAMIRWWLDKGVDGFRLDVINLISKREGLPDGNPTIGELIQFTGLENYFYGPKLHDYVKEMRQAAFEPYEAFSVAETPGVGLEMTKLLTGEERKEFDLLFQFDHLEMPGHVRYDVYRYDLNYLKQYFLDSLTRLGSNHWLSLFLENHDNPRMVSKVSEEPAHREALAKLLLAMILTLRGTPFIFQGQELAAVNQKFDSIDDLRDVEVINYHQHLLEASEPDRAWRHCLAGTRDHARVPMVWDEEADQGGFSSVEPWLPGDGEKGGFGVRQQEARSDSTLHFTRQLLKLRKEEAALRRGDIQFIHPGRKDYFAYYRKTEEATILVEMNLSDRPIRRSPEAMGAKAILSNYGEEPKERLRPYEIVIYS